MYLTLISESDFIDCQINKPDKSVEKVYDFIYICLKQDEKKDTCDDWLIIKIGHWLKNV